MAASGSLKYYSHFEIDIISALSSQLTGALDRLEIGNLDHKVINQLPREKGVYQLFLAGTLVYVGKTDNLLKRLKEHHKKISGRQGIRTSDMGFKCLSIHKNWAALAPENSLISHYKNEGSALCEWNGNGFGPHDPGRNREETNQPPEGFDQRYPIRRDWICDWIEPGEWELLDLLVALKDSTKLPYLFRYAAKGSHKRGHPDHLGKRVQVPRSNMTAEELVVLATKQLPGWQSTAFPSHLILYPESRDYTHGRVLHREP